MAESAPASVDSAGRKLSLTPTDLAKYPFTPQAAEHVRKLEHDVTEFENPYYSRMLDRAEERIKEAIERKTVSSQEMQNEIEIHSFPIAMMMVAYANNPSLKKRYALAEARRAFFLLKNEDAQKLISLARLFKWKIDTARALVEQTREQQVITTCFIVDFISYLRNSTNFHESKWKLVNRFMQQGHVRMTKSEVARLLAEEVKAHIDEKLKEDIQFAPPRKIAERAEKLKELYVSTQGGIGEEEMPATVVLEAFPPCINRLYDTAVSKKHLSHIERFALTSFLLSSGMPLDSVVECFRPTSDFSEKLTRYQVEHIAGGRGSRTRYIPPKCSTLRTHRVCPGKDETCQRVRHPLAYYREKLRSTGAQVPTKQPERG